jgi:hypothetical protein
LNGDFINISKEKEIGFILLNDNNKEKRMKIKATSIEKDDK